MHGRPLEMILTPGQQHDCTVADRLIDFITGDACLADGSYDTNAILDELHQRGIEAVIPSGQERKKKRRHDKELYKQRYLVEDCPDTSHKNSVRFALHRRVFKLARRSRTDVAKKWPIAARRDPSPIGSAADGKANVEGPVAVAAGVRRFGTTRPGGATRDRTRGPRSQYATEQERRAAQARHARERRRARGD